MYDPGMRYRQLIDLTKGLEPIRTAVVHPVDGNSLQGAIDAAQLNLMIPVLVGPAAKIRAVAEADGIDLSPYELIPTAHSHEAAARAVALARAGKVEALMKGSLHTDELMHEVVAKDTGLTTARRISHVFVMDVPAYPRVLFLTDAAINISPDLEDKRDIVQNAIDLAQVLGIETPKVAILSTVETVTPKLRSTIEAAALCKMADREQITGGVVDGPLAFDNAVSEEAARTRGSSPRWPAGPTSWSFPTSRPATCSSNNWSTWPGRRARASCSAQGADRADQPRGQAAEPDRVLRDRPPAGTPQEGHRGMTKVILVLNAGSSSVKFFMFSVGDGGLLPLFRGEFEGIGTAPHFFATDGGASRR